MRFKEDSGLTINFELVKGKFSFKDSASKKVADLGFFMGFDFISRIYRPDFLPGLLWVLQKPISYVDTMKVLLLGNFKNKLLENIENITILSLNIGKERQEKAYYITLEYAYTPDVEEEIKEISIKL